MANINKTTTQAAHDVKDAAQSAAGAVTDKARDIAATVGRKADDATEAVGSGMRSLAGTVRDHGPQEGMVGKASGAVAGALESSGRYLEEEGLSGMADDLTQMIRRNPIPSVLVGIGVGFLLARLIRS